MAREIKRITLRWDGGMLFRGGEADRPHILIDADNAEGPGPMVTLLLAAASCTGADVVLILEKMRVPPAQFWIEVAGTRREEDPRRYVALHFTYHLRGQGLDENKARRAVDLSIEKYCSVLQSLAPDIALSYDLDLG